MPGPLDGVRVIDLSTPRGEMCGRVLADLGATVIKVEPPEGCAARRLPPFIDGREGDADGSLWWATVGLGKHSLIADPTTDADRIRGLLDDADVLIESFAPGALDAFGLGPAQLKRSHPHLVHVSITPFGQHGPKAHWAATDLTIEAAGGLVGLQGDPDRPPIPVGLPQAAYHAGVTAAHDAVIALLAGGGQHLDVSMQAAVVWTLMNANGYPPMMGRNPPGTSELRAEPPAQVAPGVTIPRTLRCRDGHAVWGIHLPIVGERTLSALIEKARRDGRLPDALANVDLTTWIRSLRAGALPPEMLSLAIATCVEVIANETKASLQAFAIAERALIAAVRTMPDLLTDPHLAARGYWRTIGGRQQAGPFARLTETPLVLDRAAPALGSGAPSGTRARRTVRRAAAFEGLKVADFAWVGVGPIISKALADHGATVVHVESATREDFLRNLPPYRNGDAHPDKSWFFANFNTSKLGMTLDLATTPGRAVGRRLVDWADVVVESFTPGTLAKMGLDYATVAADRRDLVMLSTCMRGQTGPEATYSGFGNQGAALAGLVGITGWPDRVPVGPWGAYTDFIAPRFGIAALAAAIFHREQTGVGQHVDLSQIEAGIRFLEPLVLDYTVNGRVAGPIGHASPIACPHGVYRCNDRERYIAIAIETSAQWRALANAVRAPEILDPKLDSEQERRCAIAAIDAALASWCAPREAFAIAEMLATSGVPAHVVMRPTDLHADAQLIERGFFPEVYQAAIGNHRVDGLVTRFPAMRTGPLFAAPTRGQHTREVLSSLLGYGDDEIEALERAGALR